MENNHPLLRSPSLIARQSEICPSIIFGELEYAHPVVTNGEHAIILGRQSSIRSYYTVRSHVAPEKRESCHRRWKLMAKPACIQQQSDASLSSACRALQRP
eukprot:6214657-Pleurochrysis_carterae.AAC.2